MAEYDTIKAIPEVDRTTDQIADARAYKMNVRAYYESFWWIAQRLRALSRGAL